MQVCSDQLAQLSTICAYNGTISGSILRAVQEGPGRLSRNKVSTQWTWPFRGPTLKANPDAHALLDQFRIILLSLCFLHLRFVFALLLFHHKTNSTSISRIFMNIQRTPMNICIRQWISSHLIQRLRVELQLSTTSIAKNRLGWPKNRCNISRKPSLCKEDNKLEMQRVSCRVV